MCPVADACHTRSGAKIAAIVHKRNTIFLTLANQISTRIPFVFKPPDDPGPSSGYRVPPYGFPERRDAKPADGFFFGFPTASCPRIVSPSEADFQYGPAEKVEEGNQPNR